MKMMSRVLVRWALVLTCGALASPRPSIDVEPPLGLQAIDAPPPDAETFGYLIPRLASKYRPSVSWGGVADPRLYILTEMENLQNNEEGFRAKRKQPSLSIVNPMDVLRQRLLLEIARKQMRENEIQAVKNRVYLQNVGKRNVFSLDKNYDNFRALEKRGILSKMADLETNNDRQKELNDFLSSGTNNL